MTPELYAALVANQDGRCAICGERAQPLCVDHDHDTGEIRGLLCSSCNIGLGHLRDDARRLLAGVHYLKDPPARRAAKMHRLAV